MFADLNGQSAPQPPKGGVLYRYLSVAAIGGVSIADKRIFKTLFVFVLKLSNCE